MRDYIRFAACFVGAMLALFSIICAFAADPALPSTNAVLRGKNIHVIPQPAKTETGEGAFTLTAEAWNRAV